MLNAREKFRPTLSKFVWGTVALCAIGALWADASKHQTKMEAERRIAREDHNMDVAMGHWREGIEALIKGSGVCRLRGHFCSGDGPTGTWYWRRESVRGPDILDVIIPSVRVTDGPGVRISLFMRDKTGNVAAATPELVQVLDQLLAHFKVSREAAARCKAMAEPKPFTDGHLKLSCQKRPGAAYQARDGSGVEGSAWTMSIDNLQ